MFSSFKEKLLNVQEEITSSLKNLKLRRGSGNDTPKFPSSSDEIRINYEAGADLLLKYDTAWKEIHARTERNAKEAEKASFLIAQIHRNYETQWSLMWNLQTSLAHIPKLVCGVQEISDQILNVHCAFEETEEALLSLENLIELGELREKQLEHRFQLALYQERREAELQDLKVKLTNEHFQKLKEFEEKQALHLKTRQAVFQEAFETDLQRFKEGTLIPISPAHEPKNKKTPSLEEIELEEDPISLEEFLADAAKDLDEESNSEDAQIEPKPTVRSSNELVAECEPLELEQSSNTSNG